MPNDDYFYIRYKILKYLYECAKSGENPYRSGVLAAENYGISESYFNFIMRNLYTDGYITGVNEIKGAAAGRPRLFFTSELEITTKGIEYLSENSMMKKAREFIKEIKDLIPGL